MDREMREILFRGKAKDGYKWIKKGEWIEGSLFYSDDEDGTVCQIATSYLPSNKDEPVMVVAYEVDPETVRQYTGLTDKNGSKIFEGDIVKAEIKINDFSRDSVKNEINTYEVSYHEKYCYFYLKRKNNNLLFDGNWSYYLKEIEIIGNIFDNPELIGDQP